MSTYQLTIPGNPIPKARPRVVNGVAYTPERTKEWEALARDQAAVQWSGDPLRGPLALTLHFYRRTRHIVDLDNLVKSVTDALQGVCYLNDWQIVRLVATKSINRDDPGVEIEIEELAGWWDVLHSR